MPRKMPLQLIRYFMAVISALGLMLSSSGASGAAKMTSLQGPACEPLLAAWRIYDRNLVKVLTRLTYRERRTRHIPELVPELRKIQALNRATDIRSQDQILEFGNQLVDSKDLTYVNFWYYALVASTMRGRKEPMTDMDEFRRIYLKSLTPAIRDIDPRAEFKLQNIFDSMNSNLYWFVLSPPLPILIQSRGVAIPMIEAVDGSQSAFYEPGAFADAFEPYVFPVGVSRSEDNDFDHQKNKSSAAVLHHDLIHIAILSNQWNQLLRELHRSKQDLSDLHHAIRRRILLSPRAVDLMVLYDVLLHEPDQDAPVFRLIWQPEKTLAQRQLRPVSVPHIATYFNSYFFISQGKNPDADLMHEFSEIAFQLITRSSLPQ
jgi:hypothetical protein